MCIIATALTGLAITFLEPMRPSLGSASDFFVWGLSGIPLGYSNADVLGLHRTEALLDSHKNCGPGMSTVTPRKGLKLSGLWVSFLGV
jgi:hypothetical protein